MATTTAREDVRADRRYYSARLSRAVVEQLRVLAEEHSRSLQGELDWALRCYARKEEAKLRQAGG